MAAQVLDQSAIDERLPEGWTGTPEKLHRNIAFADFLTAVEFIQRIAPRCEEVDHHPDLTLSWRNVAIDLSTHSAGGVTEKDLALASAIDEVAAGLPLAEG
jgi:4a-hydroxytetrahydrobiopterin dehydratase